LSVLARTPYNLINQGAKVNDKFAQLREEVKNWPRHAVIRQNLQCFMPDFHEEQSKYWSSMAGLNSIFSSMGTKFRTIKSIRSYPYVDSNIDIIVEKSEWVSLSNQVVQRSWRKPRFKEFLEQTLVEPYKLKYQSVLGDLAAAHFYGGVRWRYVKPFNLKGIDGDHLWHELPEEYRRLVQSPDDGNILVPTEEFDMVIQAAHVTIENYRLTIGEVFHIRDTLSKPDFNRERMEAIARTLGLDYCVAAICNIASCYFDQRTAGPFPQKPIYIPFRVILGSHLRYGLKTGPLGLIRAMASLTWYPIMRIGRIMLGR
jgi:hypothetical protein